MSVVDPIELFEAVLARASADAPFDPVAVTLATSTPDGHPSARIVLLRGVDPRGFLFYTNYESRKARELTENPNAALCFYWPWLDEQVRVEGRIERATSAESERYFASRARGSQIGAWASAQSQPLAARADLERRYHEVEAEFPDGPVPRPPFWGGFLLRPARIEFWRAGSFRLHDRQVYERDGAGWRHQLLNP